MKFLATLAAFTALTASAAFAQNTPPASPPRINTGGPTGAYHTVFCPPIPPVLTRSLFLGYSCATSAGTLENIRRAIERKGDLSFVQLDAFARRLAGPEGEPLKTLTLVRQDIACEGLWMVTNNPALTDMGKVLELARRIRMVLPPSDSGSAGTFDYLREIDPEGLGRVNPENISYAKDVPAMLERVATSTTGEVGFFVQFADPNNANIRTIVEKGLTVVPVVSRPIIRAQVAGQPVYEVRQFTLTPGGMFGIGGRARTVTAACTPVALVTASPESIPDTTRREDQAELITKIRSISGADMQPQVSGMAALMASMTRVSQGAVESMEAAAEAGRRRMQGN